MTNAERILKRVEEEEEEKRKQKKSNSTKKKTGTQTNRSAASSYQSYAERILKEVEEKNKELAKPYTPQAASRRSAIQRKTESWMDDLTRAEPGTRSTSAIKRYNALEDAKYYSQMQNRGTQIGDDNMVRRGAAGVKDSTKRWQAGFDEAPKSTAPVAAETVERKTRDRDYWAQAGKQAATLGDQRRLITSIDNRKAAERDLENTSERQRQEYQRQYQQQLAELRRTRPAEYYALTMTDDEIDRSIAYFDYEGKNPVTRSVYVERTPEEEARYLRGLRQARFLGESDREREAFVKGEKDRYDKQVRAYENRRTALDDVTGKSLQNVTDTGDWVAYFDRSPKEQAEYLNNLRRARFIGESDEERAANIRKEQEHYAEQFRNYRNGPEYQEALTEAQIEAGSNIEALRRAKAIHQLERVQQTPENIAAGRAALWAQQDQLLADNGYGREEKRVAVKGMHHQTLRYRTVVTDKSPKDSRSIQEMIDKGWVLYSDFYALPEEQRNAVYAVAATDTEQAVELAQYYLKLAEDAAYQKIYDWVNKDDGSDLGGRLKQLGRRAVGLVGGTAAKLASGLDPYGTIGQSMSKLGNAAIGGGAASASRTGLFSIEALGGDESPISSDIPFIGRGKAGSTYQVGASVLQSAAIAVPAMMIGRYDTAAAKVANLIGSTLMGSSAAADDYTQCIQNGMTADQARVHATWAGINEAAFEYLSLDKLVDPDLTVSALKRWLQQAGIEASEEVCTSIANRISDSLIADRYGIENNVERRTRQLMEEGLSYRAAYSKAENEWLTEVTMDGMSGFLSGLIMGGGSEAVRGVETFRQNRANRSTEAPAPMVQQTETANTETNEAPLIRQPEGLTPSPQGEGFGSETRDQGRGTTDERAAGWGQPALRTEDGSAGTRDAGQARQNESETVNQQTEQVEQGRSDALEMEADELDRAVEHWSGLMETAREENNQEVVNRYGGYLEGLRQVQQERANAETGNNAENEDPLIRQPEGLTPSPQGEGFGPGTRDDLNAGNDLGLKEGLRRVGAKDNQTGVSASTGTTSSAELRPAPSHQWEGFTGDAGREMVNQGTVPQIGGADQGTVPVIDWDEGRGTKDGGTYDGINREGGLNDGAYGRDQGGAAEFGRAGAAETGTAEAGTAESAADSGQRDAGLGAGGPAGELGAGTGSTAVRNGERGGQRAAEQARLRNQIRALETERTSAKQIGIRGGTKNESLRVVPEELYTSEMREIANEVAELGQKVTFVAGAMEVRDRSGKTGKANGIHQVNRDGSVQYFIRADSAKYTAGTIFKHENFHELVSRNQNLWLDMVEDLFKTHTEEEISRMVDAYVEALDGIYGVYEAGMTEDEQTALRNKYLEEIFADQYAGMNRGGGKQAAARGVVGETAQRFAGDIENARQNRAGIDRRNGPGTRLSINNTRDKSVKEQMKDYRAGKMKPYDEFFFGTPSEIYGEAGFNSDPFVMAQSDFEKSKREKHNVPNRVWNNIQGILSDPILSFENGNRFGILTKEIDGDGKPLLIAIEKDSLSDNNKVNRVKSAYGLDNPNEWTNNQVTEGKQLRIYDKERAIEYLKDKGYKAELTDNYHSGDIVSDIQKIVKSEKEGVDWNGSREEPEARLSVADEDDESLGVDWIGSREENGGQTKTQAVTETDAPHPSPAATPSHEGEGFGRGTTETRDEGRGTKDEERGALDVRRYGEEGTRDGEEAGNYEAGSYEAMAREKKVEIAEKASIEGLKSKIDGAETRLRALQVMESTGLLAKDEQSQKEWKQQIKDVQESLDIYKKALKEKQEARKAEKADKAKREEKKQQRKAEKKARAKEAEEKGNKPRQARKEFRTDALNLFSVPAGKRQALGGILNDFADKVIDQGSVSETDRRDLFRQLYEAGAELAGPADDTTREIRDFVKSGRIHVPQEVRSEFGDDWIAFNQRAWGNQIHFTRDINDRGIDSWNAELAEVFPGSFDADETDMRTILENIVELAEEGKGEHVSIAEMMRRNQNETGVTIDEQMDELERKVDQLIDTFAQKAELEVKVRKQGTMQLIKERQYNREQVERQAQRKQDNDTRREVMKQLQQLNKMRKKTKPEIQKQIDKIIGNLDTMARSISPEGLENLQELSRKYTEASEDPNFLGNPYVEARLARLNQVQLNDLEISDVIELGRTISALVKTITEDKRLLTDERNKEISAAAEAANREIRNSRGSKGGQLRNFVSTDHLSPTRQIQRLGGWLRGGQMEQLSRSLEDGGVRRMNYQMQATRIFDEFLADKENQKWMKTAQGKDAEWITVKAPAGITDENGTAKVRFTTFEITPMMRVGLLMHSKNVDNLRHIETGGIVIPQKEAYLKGNLGEADARGTRVKLRPETVRAIVKDCTAQEKAFAALLEQYYDKFSKDHINEVSMLIDGFERAGGDHYYGIKVSKKFLAAQPEQVQRNLALDSIGSIVNERVHAGNPIILEDASTALADHIDLISKYYGYTAAIRDFNAVMNYTFHEGATGDEAANAYAGSVKETLQDKWGDGAQKYLDKLLADLQQSSGINETAAKFLAKLRGNLAGASLMFNPAVAFSQTASLPGAAQSLGFDALIAGLKPEKVDMRFIEKYSPVLWYRNQGNSTQELGDYMKEKGLEGKLPWAFNWIQKMDSWTIRRLWAAAEYRVSRDTDLSPGSQAEIDAGTDPFYQEVARVFQRAVFDTQPNYSEMQRPAILRSESDLTKMLTMYKTVPLQYYNMMYEAVGRLQADKARLKQNATKENQANYQESKRFAAKTFAGVLSANVVYVVMKAAIKGLTGRDRRFRDEDGNLDAGIIFKELNKDLLETYAGSIIGAGDLLNAGEKLFDAFTTGSYSRYGGTEISALSAIEDTFGGLYNMAKELHDQDLTGGLGAIKDFAKQLAMNAGIPANNLETYLLSVVKWVSPEWADRYENFFDEFEREDLKGEHGRNLRAAIRVLMDNRTEGLKDETVDELMRLWEAGQNAAIPSAIPSSVAINGEDVAIRGSDKSKYRDQWSQAVSKNLEQLLATDAYEAADDKGKARMIAKLYEFAKQQAAASVTGKETDAWVDFGKACETAGIPLEDYLAAATITKDSLKELDGSALEDAVRGRMRLRAGELDDKVVEELSRLYEAGETGSVPGDVPTSLSVNSEEIKLTAEQRAAWLQAWKKTTAENLEGLIGSKAYGKADDANKAKMVAALYELAAEGAKKEVIPDAPTRERWMEAGFAAEELGVPLSDYVAFHNLLSGVKKDKDKIQLLKDQGWNNRQNETIWLKAFADETQEKKFRNLKNGGANWADAMAVMDIGGDATEGLTEAQLKVYNQRWDALTGETTKRLMQTKAYKNADAEGREALVDKLNTYASAVAKAEATKKDSKESWINAGIAATKQGVKLEEYIVFTSQLSKIDGKNDEGESVDGLARQRQLELLNETGWTDEQKETVFLKSSMSDDSAREKEQALRSAGLTWKQTSKVMGTLGSNGNKARAITETKASEDVKLKALEVYLSETQYKSAKACRSFDVKLNLWLQSKVSADANGNDRVTQEEAENYVSGLNISWQEKAYLWQLLCPSTKTVKGTYPDTWKNNPFSTTMGRELWRYLYGN